MTWLQWVHIGVRFPAGMCSALCTKVSWSLGWGCPTTEPAGVPGPEEAALFDILPVEGAAWSGRRQPGDLIALVEPTGLNTAAAVRLASPGLLEPALSKLSGPLRVRAADGATG